MNTFKSSAITQALLLAGFTFASVPALAQEAQSEEVESTEVIQVTGIRGSLMRAQAVKMDSSSIVEVLSAEDIGKLPDTSVAESLARLPGLAGERRNGRTSGLSIRGFNENYVGTSLNGRELLGMGDNRGVEFDLYPTEIISNIVVNKTPEAGMISQGVGGTVDLQTIKPLGKDRTISINGNFEKNGKDSANPDFDNTGHRLSLNYVDSFADDTLGVALVFASLETPRQEEQFRSWGYATVDQSSDRRATDTAVSNAGDVVTGGHDSFARSALLERNSTAAVIQYAPTDDLLIQLDALYIDFEENDVRRGLEEGGAEWGTSAYNITGVEGGLVTSGFYDGFHSVVRNDARSQESELTTFGLNIAYAVNDNWTAELDFSTGKVDKVITDIESYSGVGRAGADGRPLTARSFEMTPQGVLFSDHPTIAPVDLTDPNLIRLAGPQAWGGALAPIAEFADSGDGFGPNTAQDGFVNQPVFEEELNSFRVQATGVVDWGMFNQVEFGGIYSDRTKSKVNSGAFLTSPVWPSAEPIPNVLGVTDLSFVGIPGVLAYDALGLFNSGYYNQTDAALIETSRQGDTYEVDEQLLTLYARLDIDTELKGMFLRGNLGLQLVNADQSSTGFDSVIGPDLMVRFTPVSGENSYTDVLPTVNLSLEVADNQFVRFAASKVLTRPRMDDMRPNNQVSFQFNDTNILSTNPGNSAFSGSAGNPLLKPIEANQIDLSYENYFAEDGFYAVSFFYKDLKNWHESGNTITDFTASYIPGYHDSSGEHDIDEDGVLDGPLPPQTFLGNVSFRQDGLQGFVRGWELQANLPLSLLDSSLQGLGVVASATFLDGEFDDGSNIPGLSEEAYSLTAYYESGGFEARIAGTKRDEFLSETRGLSLALVNATDSGSELWDAQISYDFSESGIDSLKGLRITLQGQNLTDEPTIQANGADARQVTQFQSYGRNFLLGANYTF
jgi:iron complex outermembrane receptor protein